MYGKIGTVALSFTVLLMVTVSAMAADKEKVLFDTDMVEAFDDGVAMIILANAPNIDLVGVTVLSGNKWAQEGVAMGVRQLEIEGRTDIPVTQGLEYPLRPSRHELFALERQQFGMGVDRHAGAFGYPPPGTWQDVYKKLYGKKATYPVDPRHSVQFIIDTIKANPGEITIAAVGPLGNLALAIRQAPEIVPMVKRIVYMGGSFFQQGNVTPAAEFNWWFDPEAAKMVVRAPWKEQTVVGLDVCEKVFLTYDLYQDLMNMLGNSEQADLIRRTTGVLYQDLGRAYAKRFVWDVIVSAVIINPNIITEERVCFIDVNDDFGPSYGQSLAYTKHRPVGTQLARIVMEIDSDAFWKMLLDKTYWKSAQ